MANEAGHFSIADVIAGLNRKLVRRHPHVFGDEASMAAGNSVESPLQTADIDSAQVLRNALTVLKQSAARAAMTSRECL